MINRALGRQVAIDRTVIEAIRPFLDAIPRAGALAAVDAAHERLVDATQALAEPDALAATVASADLRGSATG